MRFLNSKFYENIGHLHRNNYGKATIEHENIELNKTCVTTTVDAAARLNWTGVKKKEKAEEQMRKKRITWKIPTKLTIVFSPPSLARLWTFYTPSLSKKSITWCSLFLFGFGFSSLTTRPWGTRWKPKPQHLCRLAAGLSSGDFQALHKLVEVLHESCR